MWSPEQGLGAADLRFKGMISLYVVESFKERKWKGKEREEQGTLKKLLSLSSKKNISACVCVCVVVCVCV